MPITESARMGCARPRAATEGGAMVLELMYPFTGRWLVQNSPANRVPSHGTHRFGTTHAIDFVPVDDDGVSAPVTLTALLRPQPPQAFAGFGRPVLAPIAGTVVAFADDMADHAAYRGLPSVRYALTQARRAADGWRALAGNVVVLEAGPGVLVALCHLKHGSVVVSVGQRVAVGDLLGQCGNSGNSTEPHLHVQAVDRPDFSTARGLPIAFPGGLPRNGDVVSG